MTRMIFMFPTKNMYRVISSCTMVLKLLWNSLVVLSIRIEIFAGGILNNAHFDLKLKNL